VNKAIYSKQGERLREALVEMRKNAGMTQRDLAAKLKRERNLVGRVEVGERRLDVVEFYWFCKACGAKPDKVAQKLFKWFEEADSSK
jgi:transcriptional regulator with XRE-family HTH domain